ncbi:MAG: hypothetical protein CSYNP_03537 [Syntrophus sp. SKADARSKE-3]|nr:hypothetical protein [Syntrophus sp. SKADARSKE-3]
MASKNKPEVSTSEKAVAVVAGGLPPALADYRLFSPEAMAIFRDNLGGEPLEMNDLVKIKIPSGGSTVWEIPTLEGEPEAIKDLQGIIVAVRNTRAYWPNEFTGAKEKPACSSEDGIVGIASPNSDLTGGTCATCPMAEWGSSAKGGNAQACKKVQLVFIMTPGNNLPSVVPVAPGSLKPMKKYFLGLANKNIRFMECISSLKLIKDTSGGGITYSQIAPSIVAKIPTELVGQINTFVKENAASFAKVKVDREDSE